MFFALRDFSILLRYLRRFAYSVRRDKGRPACAGENTGAKPKDLAALGMPCLCGGGTFLLSVGGVRFWRNSSPLRGGNHFAAGLYACLAAGNSSFLRHRKPLFAGEVVERF